MILTSVIVGGGETAAFSAEHKGGTMRETEALLKSATPTLGALYNFSSTTLHVHQTKEKTIWKIMPWSLTFLSSRILLSLLGRSISSAVALLLYLLFIHSLLVWLRLGNNRILKKQKQCFLTGTHNSCQRDSAVKTKCRVVSNTEGEKTPFVLVPDSGRDEIRSRSCDRTGVIEGLGK